jgi:LacI family transcriptional regulator
VTSQRVDGVVIAPCGRDAHNLARLRDRDIPTVVVDRCIDGWETDTVRGDSLSGAYALAKHLIDLGHRRIAIISGPHNTSTAEDRVTGYCAALSDAGIAPDSRLIRRGEFRATSGEELAYQLLDEQPRPTAIFAANNAIAMGVIDAASKLGLRIPQDLALVCFDDVPSISHLFPFLTVVVQPVYEMGVNAAKLLLTRLDAAAPLDPRHVVLPTRMIVRHSCGARLHKNGYLTLSLPLPLGPEEESIPIPSLDIVVCHDN